MLGGNYNYGLLIQKVPASLYLHYLFYYELVRDINLNHKTLYIPAMVGYGYAYWGRGDYFTYCEVKLKDVFYMSLDHRIMFPKEENPCFTPSLV